MINNFFIIFLSIISGSYYSQNCSQIIQQTLDKISKINTITFYITSKERFNKDYAIEKGFYKIRNIPYSIYYKQIIPPTYAEVLINEKYNKEALVNPNSFPFINLKLSPYGEKLREKRHHNIYQAGYSYLKFTILQMKRKYQLSWENICEYNGLYKIDNKECFKITLTNPYYKIKDYTVNKKYSVQDLALSLNVSDYKLLELNSNLKNILQSIPINTVIKIPSDYAKKIILYIETANYIIRKIEVFDEIGLFEQYIFEDIIVNPTYSTDEFDENNKSYGFK